MEKKIVVIAKNYESGLGISRSLKQAGNDDIDLFYIGKNHILEKSNVFSNKYFATSRDDKEIIDKLNFVYSEYTEKLIVLFPSDDYTTSLLDRYRTSFNSNFVFTYVDGNENGKITLLMNKKTQEELAPKFGLKTAKSWVCKCENQEFKIPSDLEFPCFVKPLLSANGLAKAFISKCESKEELERIFQKMIERKNFEDVIIQEFIDIEEEYVIHGFCDGNRVFLPVAHQRVETSEYKKGVTILGKYLQPETLEPHIENLKKMLLSFGYHGLLSIDMFMSKGVLYLNELNFRIAGTCYGVTCAGVNVPDLWVKALTGELEDLPELNVKYGSVFINDKTAYEDLINGFRTRKEFSEWNKKADYHLIKNQQDVAPWKEFKKMMRKNQFRKFLKKILKR